MYAEVELEGGMLPDRFGKYAKEDDKLDGRPVRSFPIHINEVPQQAVSLALTFVDWDAIPVTGFCWIHWTACNIAADTTLIPENASVSSDLSWVQGANSNWSALAGNLRDPQLIYRYSGPRPPDRPHLYTLTLFALDTMLDLEEGYYLNDFRHAALGHILTRCSLEILSRS